MREHGFTTQEAGWAWIVVGIGLLRARPLSALLDAAGFASVGASAVVYCVVAAALAWWAGRPLVSADEHQAALTLSRDGRIGASTA